MIGEEINIMCSSNDRPKPGITIIHNSAIVSTEPVYTISALQRSDAGQYTCIARNKLGSHSVHGYLYVNGQGKLSSKYRGIISVPFQEYTKIIYNIQLT